MRTLDVAVAHTTRMLAKYGYIYPLLLILGTTGSHVDFPSSLPQRTKQRTKLLAFEQLGYSLAAEHRLGALTELVLVVERQRRHRRIATRRLPTLRAFKAAYREPRAASRPVPQHRPLSLKIWAYDLRRQTKRLLRYDALADATGAITELVLVNHPASEKTDTESRLLEAIVRGFRRGADEKRAA